MDFDFQCDDINGRLRSAIDSVISSSAAAIEAKTYIVGTSFNKKIISKKGIKYADNELVRANYIRSRLLQHKKNTDDLMMLLNEYIGRCSYRRKVGIDKLKEKNADDGFDFTELDNGKENKKKKT